MRSPASSSVSHNTRTRNFTVRREHAYNLCHLYHLTLVRSIINQSNVPPSNFVIPGSAPSRIAPLPFPSSLPLFPRTFTPPSSSKLCLCISPVPTAPHPPISPLPFPCPVSPQPLPLSLSPALRHNRPVPSVQQRAGCWCHFVSSRVTQRHQSVSLNGEGDPQRG